MTTGLRSRLDESPVAGHNRSIWWSHVRLRDEFSSRQTSPKKEKISSFWRDMFTQRTTQPVANVTSTRHPDLIICNGQFYTGSGWVDAIACLEGRILQTGTNDEVLSSTGPDTQIIDLCGDPVLPGFNDMHVHPLLAGIRKRECQIPQGSDMVGFRAAVSSSLSSLSEGRWLTGGQWDAATLGKVPDRSDIDDITGDVPALLNDTSGHSALANTAALAIAGITAATPDPAQGIIERRADGSPTGVLRERAIELVLAFQPKPSQSELCEAVRVAHQELLSVGVTSCTEASIGMVAGTEAELCAYRDVIAAGQLHQRTRIFLIWEPNDPEKNESIATRTRFAHPLLDLNCVKIHLDGVPTDGHTAAMLEPYVSEMKDRSDAAARFGLLLQDPETLNDAVAKFDAQGIVVKYHSVGDRAVRMGLDAIEHARKANGHAGSLHEIGHSTFVAFDDIHRARNINAVFELSPYLWGPCPINDDIRSAVGEDRIHRIWPFREIIDAGAMIVAGSDWPVVSDPNPWPAIETMLTREAPGGSVESFGKMQSIELADAIDIFTSRPAEILGKGHELGRIAAGYLADIIVLDRNPFDIATRDLHKVKVRASFVEGKLVWHDDEFGSRVRTSETVTLGSGNVGRATAPTS